MKDSITQTNAVCREKFHSVGPALPGGGLTLTSTSLTGTAVGPVPPLNSRHNVPIPHADARGWCARQLALQACIASTPCPSVIFGRVVDADDNTVMLTTHNPSAAVNMNGSAGYKRGTRQVHNWTHCRSGCGKGNYTMHPENTKDLRDAFLDYSTSVVILWKSRFLLQLFEASPSKCTA